MRIQKLKIENVLGIDHLEIEPGTVTTITGANGTGKTSILEAIKAAVGGGRDATLLRKGADKGEIVVVLDDGTTIARRLDNEGKNNLTVRNKEKGATYNQGYLDRLVDVLATNPVKFLTASAKERTALLLEAIPMEVTPEEIREATEMDLNDPITGHALEVIGRIQKRLFDERTGINREAKKAKATAEQLHESIAGFAPDDVSEKIAATEQARADLDREKSDRQRQSDREQSEAKRKAAGAYDEAVSAKRAGVEEEIRTLEQQIANLRASLSDFTQQEAAKKAKAEADADAEALSRMKALDAEFAPKHEALSAELAKLREHAEQATRYATTKKIVDEHIADGRRLEDESTRITMALEGLERLKKKKTTNLPIQGLTVHEGAIAIDGVPLERINTARQLVDIAVEVAILRAKELGIICVDGAECLDDDTFQALTQKITDSGLQAFVTRVTDGPREIQTV